MCMFLQKPYNKHVKLYKSQGYCKKLFLVHETFLVKEFTFNENFFSIEERERERDEMRLSWGGGK